MNQEKISVGMAPDYVLTMGKTIFHHRASIEVTRLNGAMHRENLTHKSLYMLSRQVAEKTKAFAPDFRATLKWTFKLEMEAKIHVLGGEVIIKLHLPSDIAIHNRKTLYAAFVRNLQHF